MPASTNFLQFNPSQNNQENDAAYLIDTVRVNGAGVDGIWPSSSANKTLYQVSTFVAAFAQMLVNNGISTSDANIATLAAALGVIYNPVKPNLLSVAYSPTPTFDCSQANGFAIIMTGNITSFTVINATLGQYVTLDFKQDSAGGRTVNFPANVLNSGVVDGTPNMSSAQLFQVFPDGNLHPIAPMVVS